MPKVKEDVVRYRIAVPEADTLVHEWMKAQLNASMSLRMLIKDDVIRNGCTDVTCRIPHAYCMQHEVTKDKGNSVVCSMNRVQTAEVSPCEQKQMKSGSAEEYKMSIGSTCQLSGDTKDTRLDAAMLSLLD